jgi:WD40 repeat protein
MTADPRGDHLLVGTREGNLLIIDTRTFTISKQEKISDDQIECIVPDRGNSIWVTTSVIEKFDLDTLKGHYRMTPHQDVIIGFKLWKNTIISASEDCNVMQTDVNNSNSKPNIILYSHNSPIISFDMDEESSYILTFCSDCELKLFHLNQNKIIKQKNFETKIWSLKIIPNTKRFVIGDHDGMLKILDLETFGVIKSVNAHESRIKSISIDAGAKLIATGSFDQTIKVFHIENLDEKGKFEVHNDWVRGVDISADPEKRFAVIYGIGDDCVVSKTEIENPGFLEPLSCWQKFKNFLCCKKRNKKSGKND